MTAINLAAWCDERTAESSFIKSTGFNEFIFASGVCHCLTLLADPNTPNVDEVLAAIQARRSALLRHQAMVAGVVEK